MQSKAAEHDVGGGGGGVPLPAASAMPYEPSVPCAACARGTDPLRAACISMTERGAQYFCSRSCRESYVKNEAEHREKVARAPEPRPAVVSSAAPRTSFEAVARRVTPTEPSTPAWPLIAGTLAMAAGLLHGALALPFLDRVAALGFAASALGFTTQTKLVRQHGSTFAWLCAPVGVVALSVASLLTRGAHGVLGLPHAQLLQLAAALGLVLMWLREHWLERERARWAALRSELGARMSPRVRVSSLPPGGEPAPDAAQWSERPLDQLAVGDELVLEAGAVVPVDGVVVSGLAELMPYPRARTAVERKRGELVLAGALITHGTLRLRATQVGAQRALFQVFGEPDDERAQTPSRGLSIARAAERMEHGIQFTLVALLLSLLGPSGSFAKLAALGSALLAVPAIALARGIRSAYRRTLMQASARGIHYRDPESVERTGAMDTAVLRVEGPLVSRTYTLTEIVSLSEGLDARQLLELALAAGPAHESHGIARAVREHAAALGVEPAPLKRLVHTRGAGVSGLTDGQGQLVFGSRAALLGTGVSVAVADREAQRAEVLGQRVVFLSVGGRARGLFVFTQTVQPEARLALQTLFDAGLEVELVSGDHRPTVEAIGRTLDITQIKAELSSEARAAEVRRLRDGDAKVVAIGHVPEDQALLAAAEVSLSFDAAAEPGEHDVLHDITTASPDLRDAAAALTLPRRLRRELTLMSAASAALLVLALFAALGALAPLACLSAALTVDWLCLARPLSRLSAHSLPEDRALRGK